MTEVASGTWQWPWNTVSFANGTYTLQALYHGGQIDPKTGQPIQSYDAASAIFTVTVKNGFEVVTDPAKTFAKVNSPTNGQRIPSDGSGITLSTDHRITWMRYDDCQSLVVTYKFMQKTTWSTITVKYDPTTNYYTWQLPLERKEHVKSSSGWSNVYQSGLPIGFFSAEAFSFYPHDVAIGHGLNNFEIYTP